MYENNEDILRSMVESYNMDADAVFDQIRERSQECAEPVCDCEADIREKAVALLTEVGPSIWARCSFQIYTRCLQIQAAGYGKDGHDSLATVQGAFADYFPEWVEGYEKDNDWYTYSATITGVPVQIYGHRKPKPVPVEVEAPAYDYQASDRLRTLPMNNIAE